MVCSNISLSIFIVLVALTWTFIIKNDDNWPWSHTKYLTRSNWTTLLKTNDKTPKIHHSVWFIFHYLAHCGHCKRAKPGWEAAAQYSAGWSRYIKIGAYDCESETTSPSDICQDEGYPQWRIFCPLTNSTQLAFDSDRRSSDAKPEEILMWAIKKINKIAPQCYGKSWPIRAAIEPQTKDDLNRLIPTNIQKFQLFISDDLLLYSLYVLNNSKTVFKEPIYRLANNNPILQDMSIWKGVKVDDGQISLEQIDSTKAMEPFVLNTNRHSHTTDKPQEKQAAVSKPTVSDIDSAVIWMINKDLRRKLPTLFEDVKAWLNVLHTYYPGSDTMQAFLHDLINFMNNHTTVSAKELQSYINSTSTIKLPDVKFDYCNGSDSSKRGYPCALWLLFHSMTVKQAILAEQNQLSSSTKPSDLIVSIREFIRKFFLCAECAQHFVNMTANVENEINSYKESVLYLWQGHNQVNRRLRYEEPSNDPDSPKVPFPAKQQCNTCVLQVDEHGDAVKHDENETFQYLKGYYNLQNLSENKNIGSQNLSGKQNIGMKQQYNHCFIFVSFVLSMFVSFVS